MNDDTSGCSLCGAVETLVPHDVPPDASVAVCATCKPQLEPGADLDAKHWFCLQEAIWSDNAAVQVLSYRLLTRLAGQETWARDLLDQAYLDDSTLAWAQAGQLEEVADGPATVDSNGTVLADGDAVTLIKDLDVKGAGFTAKRGTLVKSIRLTDDPRHVEGKVNGVTIVLVAGFLKKAG